MDFSKHFKTLQNTPKHFKHFKHSKKPKTEEHNKKTEKTQFKMRHVPWSKGRTVSEATRQKIRESKVGEKNPMWGKTPWNKKKRGSPNHRILKVEYLPYKKDVYCMELPGYDWFYANDVLVHNCKFCSVNVVYGKRIYRQKTPERTLKDFEILYDTYKTKHIEIIDDTFTLNKKHAESICELLIERDYGFNMWAFSRVDTSTPRLYEKMKAAGINWVFMGVEAGNEDILDGVVKLSNLEKIRDAIHIAHEAGLNVGTNYVFGLENETMTTMNETLALALELCTEWANFFIAMPYPGTEMYQKADPSLLPEEWEQYGFFAPNARPLPTKTLTSGQIIQFRDAAFYMFYSSEKYLDMIEKKFGKKQYIQEMLQRRIGRK